MKSQTEYTGRRVSDVDQVGQNPWLGLNFHLIAWWLRMACIVAEELRRRSLISNSSVWSKLFGLWAVLSRVSFLAYLGETATE